MWETRKGKTKNLDSREVSSRARGEGGDSVSGLTSGQNDSSSTDESMDSEKSRPVNPVKRGLKKIGSVFRRSQKDADKVSSPIAEPEPSPKDNIRASNPKNRVRLIVDDTVLSLPSKTPKGDDTAVPPSSKTPKGDDTAVPPFSRTPKGDEQELPGESLAESPSQRNAKDMAKSILKHAGRSARELKTSLSRKTRKSKAESETLPAELDSSDDESTLSSTVDAALADTGLVAPSSAVSTPESTSGNSSFKAKDSVQTAELSGSNSFEATGNATPTGAKGE